MTSSNSKSSSVVGSTRALLSSRVLKLRSSKPISITRLTPTRYPLATKQVVEVQCDRCPRKEYVEATGERVAPVLVVKFGAQEVKYDDLCSSCMKAVAGHLAEVTKQLGGKSPGRRANKRGALPPPSHTPSSPSTSLLGSEISATQPKSSRRADAPARGGQDPHGTS